MNSEKHYHEEYSIHIFNQINSNFIPIEWGDNNAASNMNNYQSQQDDLEYLFNNRYSDVEQYQILQQSDSLNQYNPNELNILDDNPINVKWNAEEEADFQSSEKQQAEEYMIQDQMISHQNNMMRSQQTLNRNYSHRSSSTSSQCSVRDNSSSADKSSSSQNKNSYSNSLNQESSSAVSESTSQRKKKLHSNDSHDSEFISNNDSNKPAKNKQSQHKNVVKNIGLGFKNYLIDSKSPLNEKIQDILKENRHNHFEFRQWINQAVKLDQKKEIYKALNIKHEDIPKIQSYKRILFKLFCIFFEEQYASSYLWRNNNIQNKEIHIQFIKHFIQSSRDTDYLLKKWK